MTEALKDKTGLVVKSTGSRCVVRSPDGEMLECVIKGKFRMQGIRTTNPVAVGDVVHFRMDPESGSGVIFDISDRRNYIVRKSSNLSRESQILAANLDLACLVVTLHSPETYTEFADRFLAAATAYGVPAALIFHKMDLYLGPEKERVASLGAIYREVGYQTLETSVPLNLNTDALQDLFAGKVTLISGLSGVGKSSLINLLGPEQPRKTGVLSRAHMAGKHTTTFAEMVPVRGGGYIIDTPGIRGFGLSGFSREEVYHFFPEMFRIAAHCQYHNCLHLQEPGCAVREAVRQGRVAESRYVSYLSIMDDQQEKYR